jgi:hypothetical protein
LDHSIWGGILAAPLIGVLIGHLSKSIGARSRRVQIAASLLNLYLAATCFAVAVAVFDLVWGSQRLTLAANAPSPRQHHVHDDHTAPILAWGATRAAGSETATTASYGDLIGLVGFGVFAFPFFSFAATLIVMAVKVSLVLSWATEGTVFFASYYYRNVFWMYLPFLVLGGGLIGVRQLIGDRW